MEVLHVLVFSAKVTLIPCVMASQLNLGFQLTRLAELSWWRPLAGLPQMPPSSC